MRTQTSRAGRCSDRENILTEKVGVAVVCVFGHEAKTDSINTLETGNEI
jgi:hypothetical protein